MGLEGPSRNHPTKHPRIPHKPKRFRFHLSGLMAQPPGMAFYDGSYFDTPQKQKGFPQPEKETPNMPREENAPPYHRQQKPRRSPKSATRAPRSLTPWACRRSRLRSKLTSLQARQTKAGPLDQEGQLYPVGGIGEWRFSREAALR